MFNADVLTFQEFAMQEELPLSAVHNAVLEFLSNHQDVALFGAQAVNAYVSEPRMTQDVDILAKDAEGFAIALRDYLSQRFRIAIRIRKVGQERGFRLYQVRKSGNRHLADIRQADHLPPTQDIAGVPVIAPADLIASKVISNYQRRGKPKSGTDWRDLAMLFLAFPELKSEHGPVYDSLLSSNVEEKVFDLWNELVAQEIEPEDEDEEF
jgi:hypothetical protein